MSRSFFLLRANSLNDRQQILAYLFSVESFHLFRYLDEEAYRFNTQKAKDGARFVDTLRPVVGKRVTYKSLTGKVMLPATT